MNSACHMINGLAQIDSNQGPTAGQTPLPAQNNLSRRDCYRYITLHKDNSHKVLPDTRFRAYHQQLIRQPHTSFTMGNGAKYAVLTFHLPGRIEGHI